MLQLTSSKSFNIGHKPFWVLEVHPDGVVHNFVSEYKFFMHHVHKKHLTKKPSTALCIGRLIIPKVHTWLHTLTATKKACSHIWYISTLSEYDSNCHVWVSGGHLIQTNHPSDLNRHTNVGNQQIDRAFKHFDYQHQCVDACKLFQLTLVGGDTQDNMINWGQGAMHGLIWYSIIFHL